MKNKILTSEIEKPRFHGNFKFEDARIRVTLDSIRHGFQTNFLDVNFDVSTIITDGMNPKGEFARNNILIIPGETRSIDETIFTGYYDNKCDSADPINLNFIFLASNHVVANFFHDVAPLNFNDGIQNFLIRIRLEDNNGRSSTLEFRGTIDIGCT